MRISDWSSDVCSSDLTVVGAQEGQTRQWTSNVQKSKPMVASQFAGFCRTISSEVPVTNIELAIFALVRFRPCTRKYHPTSGPARQVRSAERRVGKEGVSTVKSRGARVTKKKKT